MQLPPIIQDRTANWRTPPTPPIDRQKEFADWVWEKWNIGQLTAPLPYDTYSRALDLKRRKDLLQPTGENKVTEELGEVLEEAPQADKDVVKALAGGKVGLQQFERLQHALGLPMTPLRDYMDAAINKLEGRVALNEAYPQATSKDIKYALGAYETLAGIKAFGVKFGQRQEREIRESLLHKAGCHCKRCKKTLDLYQSHLHHTNPNKKKFGLDQGTIKRVLRKYGQEGGMVRILEEFKKTVLLCEPCHKTVHKTGERAFFDKAYWPFLDRPRKRENRRLFNTRRLDDVA